MDCMFKDGEDISDAKIAEGVITKFGFHPSRLESHRIEIGELLAELPEQFQQSKGGGWSFLNACMTKDDDQWGEHRDIDQLLCLGIAIDQAKILMSREMWSAFPGGMPYFSVNPSIEILSK